MKIGIIGYGNIAKVHTEILKNNPNFDLVAVLDEDEEKRKELKENIDFYTLNRLQEFLDDVEAVAICTPPYLHAKQAIQALRAGKHVLVEKPIAIKLKDALKMGEVAKKAKKVLMPSAHFAYNPRIAAMISNRESYGEITNIQIDYLEDITKYTSSPWIFSRERGGGVIMDDGTNTFDWLTRLVDNIKINKVKTGYDDGRGGKKEVETTAKIDFTFGANYPGQINLSFIHKGEETIRAILETKKGKVTVNYLDPNYNGDYRIPEYTAIYREFARRIRTRKIFDKRELDSLRLVEDCYKLAKRQ